MINTIKQKIITKLQGITSIAEVNTYEKVGFDKNPAVNVTMTGNSAEFWSVASNQRAYNFKIKVIIPLDGNPITSQYDNSKQETENTMGDVVDAILTAFDTDITLGGTVDFLRASPSEWNYSETAEGWVRMADINLQAIKHIIVRS